ncbi:hypothetical protein HYPSUDRAFT_954983 [Hypholoma sublateritium FD-334 SS-4]|uniref:Uncharacterized protein n=1 Tax=Hypholoma sublateritium (strain FD-334 SS-4) TaxID=945553 RepID=A0A0D2PE82_HYPSF|nr:hypothetical protein HYPSUDRAFT_954983 [Hypholoma sublateritium FD-334 SS-4]
MPTSFSILPVVMFDSAKDTTIGGGNFYSVAGDLIFQCAQEDLKNVVGEVVERVEAVRRHEKDANAHSQPCPNRLPYFIAYALHRTRVKDMTYGVEKVEKHRKRFTPAPPKRHWSDWLLPVKDSQCAGSPKGTRSRKWPAGERVGAERVERGGATDDSSQPSDVIYSTNGAPTRSSNHEYPGLSSHNLRALLIF